MRLDGDSVLVKLSDLDQKVDSDRYFTEQYRELMENVLKESVMQRQKVPFKVPIHSSRTGLR